MAASSSQKVVWITGASSGIGAAVATEFAARGWTVAITARRAQALEEVCQTSKEGRIHGFVGDTTDADRMATIVAEIENTLGPIGTAILNAGTYFPLSAKDFDLAQFESNFKVNVFGTAYALKPVQDRMMARGQGEIMIVSSVAGYSGLPLAATYGATKAALINFAESYHMELKPFGVAIKLINPGFIDTPLTRKNDFPMPFLMPVDKAAKRVVDFAGKPGFELTFPRRFTWMLKVLRMLPYPIYLALVGRGTGASQAATGSD